MKKRGSVIMVMATPRGKYTKMRKIDSTDPYQVAARLEVVVKREIETMTPEKAKKFRSSLSMYDENGELKEFK